MADKQKNTALTNATISKKLYLKFDAVKVEHQPNGFCGGFLNRMTKTLLCVGFY